MKRAGGTTALTISLALLLCACGSAGTEQRIAARQAELAAAGTLSFTAAVTANLENEVFEFTLACTESGGTVTAEVAAPASIAGIRARMGSGGTALEFENVSLPIGEGAGYPLAALPVLTEVLRGGHILRTWTEHGHLAAEFYAGDDITLTVWFGEETMAPAFASLSAGGTERVRFRLTGFHTNEDDP